MILNLDCTSRLLEKHLRNSGPNSGQAPLLGTLSRLVCVWAPGRGCFKAPGGFPVCAWPAAKHQSITFPGRGAALLCLR